MDLEVLTGTDAGQLRRMQELARGRWGWSSRWHPGELAAFWWEHGGPRPGWRVATWTVGRRTVAWAWVRTPGRLDLQVDPAHLDVLPAVLEWFAADDGPGPRAVTVLDAETWLVDPLAEAGFRPAPDGPYFVHLRRGLGDLAAPPPRPAGFTLRPVRGAEDAALRAALHSAAFGGTVAAADYRALMADPSYRPELDRVVEASDGTPAAFCLGWLDATSGVVVLEPVGTDPRYRRLGLARAAVHATLAAATDQGATAARVCARGDDGAPAARATYESLGFRRYARNVRLVTPPA